MHAHMKTYDCLIDDIHYELKAAEHYAKQAMKHKSGDRALAETYYDIGRQELSHAAMLKEQVAHIVSGHDVLPILWERDHERIVDWMADAKSKLDMLKA